MLDINIAIKMKTLFMNKNIQKYNQDDQLIISLIIFPQEIFKLSNTPEITISH